MQKLKPLIPILREKKRYVVFEVISKTPIKSLKAVGDAVLDSFLSFFGTKELAKAGLIIIKDKFNDSTQRGIIRVSNRYVDALKSALTLVKQSENQEVIIRSRGVSGILKKTARFMEG